MDERFSFAYLMRAEDEMVMKVLDSPMIVGQAGGVDQQEGEKRREVTCGEWIARKFGVLRVETNTDKEEWVLTGRMEEVRA